jgi:hypothetical protein
MILSHDERIAPTHSLILARCDKAVCRAHPTGSRREPRVKVVDDRLPVGRRESVWV